MGDDLSDYERVRLANIQRNNQFLLNLGISEVKKDIDLTVPAKKKVKTENKSYKENRLVCPTRRSERISKIKEFEISPEIEDDNDISNPNINIGGIDYDDFPSEPNELDDFEFEVFVALKQWRLGRCRELDIEPYKVFQNRTLVEAVRRRRNDPTWAYVDPIHSVNDNSDSNLSKVSNDLLQCWGIGPAKVKKDGFGHELVTIINAPDLESKLEQLRVSSKTLTTEQ